MIDKSDLKIKFRKQQGAMLVEFLVVASSVLISLFILIPILAKITDVRHKTEQAAQYASWERSVWYGEKIGGEKSRLDLSLEAEQRVFTAPNTLINSKKNKGEIDSFHYFVDSKSGTAIYSKILGKRGSTQSALKITDESDKEQHDINLFESALDFKSSALKAVGIKLPSAISSKGVTDLTSWKVGKNGYFNNTISMDVKQPSWFSAFSDDSITMNTQKSLLVDGWGTGGRKHNKEQVEKMQAKAYSGNEKELSEDLSFSVTVAEIPFYGDIDIDVDLSIGGFYSPKKVIKKYRTIYRNLPEIGRDLDDLDIDYIDTDELLHGHTDNQGKTIGHQLGTY